MARAHLKMIEIKKLLSPSFYYRVDLTIFPYRFISSRLSTEACNSHAIKELKATIVQVTPTTE